jgi:hypothetical protein
MNNKRGEGGTRNNHTHALLQHPRLVSWRCRILILLWDAVGVAWSLLRSYVGALYFLFVNRGLVRLLSMRPLERDVSSVLKYTRHPWRMFSSRMPTHHVGQRLHLLIWGNESTLDEEFVFALGMRRWLNLEGLQED